ncbi:MAG: hypothetical protein ABR545_02365 [Cyclonatronaceae bacterium]
MHHPEYKNSSVLSVLEQDILLVEYPIMEHFLPFRAKGIIPEKLLISYAPPDVMLNAGGAM